MATAIVTGTSSGIGKSIAMMLLDEGYKVIGLSRSEGAIKDSNFTHIAVDLTNKQELENLKSIFSSITSIDLLINAAGIGRFEPHEELSMSMIFNMIELNLTAPIILSNLLLRSLKKSKGMIINITSIEATRNSKFSALYTATKSGLRSFGQTLFEELRNSDVRVLTLNPDMTDTSFFDNLRFGVGKDDSTKLLVSDISNIIKK